MKKSLILAFFCIGLSCANNKLTQQTIIKGSYTLLGRSEVKSSRILGYVKDKETGKVLSSANVSFEGNNNVGTITDEQGFFILEVAPGSIQIKVSNVGNTDLRTKPIRIGTNEELEIEFYLGTNEIK